MSTTKTWREGPYTWAYIADNTTGIQYGDIRDILMLYPELDFKPMLDNTGAFYLDGRVR